MRLSPSIPTSTKTSGSSTIPQSACQAALTCADGMKQSPLLQFEASAFRVVPGEDEQTNPGVYGKALAVWLAQALRTAGMPAGDAIAEDFGWCIPVNAGSNRLFVACANVEGAVNRWQVFACIEARFFARLTGSEGVPSLPDLYAAVKRCLESANEIKKLQEHAA